MSAEGIQEQLGHASLAMAMYYSRGTEEGTGDAYAATKTTGVVDVPTRERPRVIPPDDVLGLLQAAGILDAQKLAKLREVLQD